MKYSEVLGYASAFGWLISSILWILAAKVQFKSKLPDINDESFKGVVHINPTPSLIGVWVDGKPQITSSDLRDYINSSGIWNGWAASLSAVAAILSAISVALSAHSL